MAKRDGTAGPAPVELLVPSERRIFALVHGCVRYLGGVQVAWNHLFMVNVVRLLAGGRLDVRGLEHLAPLDRSSRVIFVANHRSFFDFFVIGAMLYTRTKLGQRIIFPVRSPFFYDHALGVLVNAVMSGLTMYPPILRDAERGAFNRWAVDRCVDWLAQPGHHVGFHPEGSRNKGDDPYVLLRAQPGVGRVALASADVTIVPVFVLGLSNSLGAEVVRQLRGLRARLGGAPPPERIAVWFGPPVDVEDLRAKSNRVSTQLECAQRCMAAIERMAHRHRDEARST